MNDKKRQVSIVAEALNNLIDPMYPTLGIDINGCVDEAPILFQLLTKYWPGKVYVISIGNDYDKTKAYLDRKNIRCDELILVNSMEEKAEVIGRKGIMTFIDDQPEFLTKVREECHVMLFRNGNNFDYNDKKWTFTDRTKGDAEDYPSTVST